MDYNFNEIEKKWQQYWKDNNTYKVDIDKSRPKFYVLDMFPYPSGAGLHVGHPLGYIASDIFARYKRHKGFNVLHPMGYDAYGLPAEQYAIKTGQHPEITTNQNIARYREQLEKIGFCYDWDREVRTCEPKYYKWTQWAFLQMFKSYYNTELDKARPITELVEYFEKNGSEGCNAHTNANVEFTADDAVFAQCLHTKGCYDTAVIAARYAEQGITAFSVLLELVANPLDDLILHFFCIKIFHIKN